MAAHPTFGRCAEIPVDRIRAEQWQACECTMCHGTGTVLSTLPNPGPERPGSARSPSLDARCSRGSVVVSAASYDRISQRPGFPRYLVRRIEELVAEHLEGGVSVAALGRSLGYSPSHFRRMFRESFGTTPHAYLMQRRVAVAQHLLTRTDLTLVDIALKTGFADQSHLSRSFRRFAGVPPRAYRSLARTFAHVDATISAAI